MAAKVLAGAVGAAWFGVASAQTSAGCETGLSTERQTACAEMEHQITAMVAEPAVARAHWGVMVASVADAGVQGDAGSSFRIYGMNEGQFFQPASNTKLFTTAAAMALLGAETRFQTRVFAKGGIEAGGRLKGDVVMVGGGEANLSGRDVPYVAPGLRPKIAPGAPPLEETDPLRYLAEMADRLVATGLKVVTGDVVGDDTLFPWEPYPSDWSIDDMVWGYGAPVSALSVADNQMRLTIRPGSKVGEAAAVVLEQAVRITRSIRLRRLCRRRARKGASRWRGRRARRCCGCMEASSRMRARMWRRSRSQILRSMRR